MGGTEIVLQAGGGVVALLVAHDHHRLAAETPEPAHDGLVVGELAVPPEFDEIVDQALHIVQEVRPVGMARHLGLLPCVELGVGLAAQAVHLGAQGQEVAVERVGSGGLGQLVELLDLGLDLGDRLLEIQVMAGGRGHPDACSGSRRGET